MRILLYSRVFPPAVGGMERFAESLAGWLAAQGHEVTVATRTPAGLPVDGHLPYRVLRSPDFATLSRALARADVVHINGLSLKGILSALAAGSRPVVTHTGHQAVCPTGLAWSASGRCSGSGIGPCASCLERGLVAKAKVTTHRVGTRAACRNVTVSRYLERRLRLPRSLTIYNPVSSAVFGARAPGPGDDSLVGFAGRLVAEKGLDLLLRAIALVPEARLEVAGDGPLRDDWLALADRLGIAGRVRFVGALPFEHVAELYARAAVVCVPSAWDEPFGYAAAEAMAMERPVVATPNGALVELLADGRGFLGHQATPEALASELARALGDDRARAEVASRAHAYAAAELAIDALGDRYLQVYQGTAG